MSVHCDNLQVVHFSEDSEACIEAHGAAAGSVQSEGGARKEATRTASSDGAAGGASGVNKKLAGVLKPAKHTAEGIPRTNVKRVQVCASSTRPFSAPKEDRSALCRSDKRTRPMPPCAPNQKESVWQG